MDTRRLFSTIILVGVMMLGWFFIQRMWNPAAPPPPPAGSPVYPKPVATPMTEQGAAETTIRLGDPSRESKDKVSITINNRTAGIVRVQLNANDFAEHAKSKKHPVPEPLTLLESHPGLPLPYSTLGVHIFMDGVELPLATPASEVEKLQGNDRAARIASDNAFALWGAQYVWKVLPPPSPYEARLLLTVNNGSTPVAEITKIFRVKPDSYNIVVSHEVKNLADKPIKVQIDQMASTDLPMDLTAAIDTRFYHAGALNEDKKIIVTDRFHLAHSDVAKMGAGHTKEVGKLTEKNPIKWISASGRFFTSITRPDPEMGAPAPFELYSARKVGTQTHVKAAYVDVLHHSTDAPKQVSGLRLVGNPVEVSAKGANAFPLMVFFGPMKQQVIQGDVNAEIGTEEYNYFTLKYVELIQISAAICSIYNYCAIGPLTYYMLRFLDFLHGTVAFGNYGVAIIIMVLIVKAALHPLTRKAQIEMAKMGKKMKDIQPLVEASKKKYPKDRQKQSEEMMRIYRENNVNPAGGVMGCLPMLLQTPIWIAVWAGLATDIDLRHAMFIPGWINDLSAPDRTISFAPINVPLLSLLMGPISAINILPLLGAVIFIQMKVQMASQPKPADPQQAQMQKMSTYMVLIFPLFLYSMPSGINLYYFASTLGGLVDTYFVRKSLKKAGILPSNAPVLPTHVEKDEDKAK